MAHLGDTEREPPACGRGNGVCGGAHGAVYCACGSKGCSSCEVSRDAASLEVSQLTPSRVWGHDIVPEPRGRARALTYIYVCAFPVCRSIPFML